MSDATGTKKPPRLDDAADAKRRKERPVRAKSLALRGLTLRQCPRVTAACVSWLAPRLSRLETLDLAFAPAACTDASISCVARCCPRLRVLLLGKAPDDKGVSKVAATNAAFLTDAAVYAVGEHLRDLERLDLSHHPFVTALGWQPWQSAHPRLRELCLRGCAAVAKKGLACAAIAAPSLIDVDTTGCTLLEPEDVQKILGRMRYAAERPNGAGCKPGVHAAAAERRDEAYARLHLEHRCQVWICCGWRLRALRGRVERRVNGKVIKRAIMNYQERRRDEFRQHFKRLVNYRRIIARWSSIRIQRFLRKWFHGRVHRSAKRIQRFYRSTKAKWLQTFMTLVTTAQKLVAKVWRGYKSRQDLPLDLLRLSRQWEQELGSIGGGPSADAARNEDEKTKVIVRTTRAARIYASRGQRCSTPHHPRFGPPSAQVDQIRGHVSGLRAHMSHTLVDLANETMAEKQARLRKSVKARLQETELSLPLSRKRRVPVYGDARPYAYDAKAAARGAAHVFGETVWPEPPKRTYPGSAESQSLARWFCHVLQEDGSRSPTLPTKFAKKRCSSGRPQVPGGRRGL